MSLSILPNKVTTPINNFNVQSAGYTQGFVIDNFSQNSLIRSGIQQSPGTDVIIAGRPIGIRLGSALQGNLVYSSTEISSYDGFAIYNGTTSATNVPGNTAPSIIDSVNYINKGDRFTLAVECSDALYNILSGVNVQQGIPVSWNYTTNQLDVFNGTTAFPVTVTGVAAGNSQVIDDSSVDGDINFVLGKVALIIV